MTVNDIEIIRSWKDECGVFGVWNCGTGDAARLTYLALYAMQHRGQEACGIVTLDNPKQVQHAYKGLGLVGDVFNEKILANLHGDSGIGHVRYSTAGENTILNTQPLTSNLLNGPVALAHNGNIVNQDLLREALKKQGAIFQGTNDTEVFMHLIARHESNDLMTALYDAVQHCIGAYSMVVLSHDKLIAIRDPLGLRPLVLGQMLEARQSGRDNGYVIASESCAFDLIGAELIREIEPGECLQISNEGLVSKKLPKAETDKAFTKTKAQCVFEHVYFARPDSIVFGLSVYESRKNFGKALAEEDRKFIEAQIEKFDYVIPVPDSGIAAALGYSQQSGIPLEFGIIRNHYVGRTFIQPQQAIRDFGVRVKLNAQASVLNGKKIVVIDDSLVRGTTSQKIITLLRQAGAREVHFRIASPPTLSPCYYGVDTPDKEHLIAAKQSIESIQKYIGADSLKYLSIEGMFKALARRPDEFCSACFTGDYPTSLNGVRKSKKPTSLIN